MSTIIQKIAGRLAETKQVFLHGLPEKSGISVPRFDVRMGGQFLYQKRLFEKIHNLEGDVVECGVGHGKSFLAWCYLLLDEGAHRKVWGFDSFAGFPEPRKEDSSPRKPQKGDWSGVGLPEMSAMLLGGGLPKEWFYSHATLVEGFFDKSLPKFTGKKIALLHLDVDLYDSYKVALEYL